MAGTEAGRTGSDDRSLSASRGNGGALRRTITWGPDGLPVPTTAPLLSKSGIENLAVVAASLPYKVPELVLPPAPELDASKIVNERYEQERDRLIAEHEKELEFDGLTNAEVMFIKIARRAASGGDSAAENTLLDRMLGKPKQSVESKNLNLTYEDLLREKAARATPAEVIDVKVESSAPDTPSPNLWEGLI